MAKSLKNIEKIRTFIGMKITKNFYCALEYF